ncbi:MAG: YtxH domain-containing protein [Gemmatimonadetes bacterium]|nr:YtxH domain-containing protein [Gemmatimonadota bacterium]
MFYSRYYPGNRSGGRLTGFVIGCCAGFVVGSALGVLLAPHRGDITRRKITRAAGETKDQVVEKVEDLMVHRREDGNDEEEAIS